MTQDSQKPSSSDSQPTDTDQQMLERLRPELRPIAQRHGLAQMVLAQKVAGANLAIDWLMAYSHTHSKMKPHVAVLIDAQATFVDAAIKAMGWSFEGLGECIMDLSKAAKLAGFAREGQQPPSQATH